MTVIRENDHSYPVSNTGGNSHNNNSDIPTHGLMIDTLSITGKLNDFPSKRAFTDNDIINEFSALLQSKLGLTPYGDHSGGMNGYENS